MADANDAALLFVALDFATVKLIEQTAAAERLARALLLDVRTYPQPDDAAQIQEARELFHKRVSPSLHSIFETELVLHRAHS